MTGLGTTELEEFSGVEERIGENPARFLQLDLMETGSRHSTNSGRPLLIARIRGIVQIEVAACWIRVELELADRNNREPRQLVIDALQTRIDHLREHGETNYSDLNVDRSDNITEPEEPEPDPVWRHVACDSTDVDQESYRTWFCNTCEQRTNRVEQVDPTQLEADT